MNTENNTTKPVSSYDLNIFQRIINFKVKEYIGKNKLAKFEGEKNFSFTLAETGIKLSDLDFISNWLVNDINTPNASLKSTSAKYYVSSMLTQTTPDWCCYEGDLYGCQVVYVGKDPECGGNGEVCACAN